VSERLLNIYLYGSYVYGTNDDQSDIDYIFVVDHQKEKESQTFAGRFNITSYPAEYFQVLLDNHSVSVLECFFLPDKSKIELYNFQFNLNKAKLRESFSAKSSNSWVKAKKKIDLHQEYRVGMKSLFHSLRILNFGIQIAQAGRIVAYNGANRYWNKMVEQDFKKWQPYKDYWQGEYNRLKSEFRKICPMEKEDEG
jgi:predicted nucleotidyltransferase